MAWFNIALGYNLKYYSSCQCSECFKVVVAFRGCGSAAATWGCTKAIPGYLAKWRDMELGTCVTPFEHTSCVQCTKRGEPGSASRTQILLLWTCADDC